ncbi:MULTISPECIES: hypothetical protein [unclassified Brevundimonas]|uniref:hypothetical protein n=1 Tax=unclassified Brevundimonas TaxID=2622653 RepID=UPI0025C2F6A2|nr:MULTISPECIES: hypothetical protein [unclassified Brevundimonas]
MTRIADVSAHFVAEKRAMRASWSAIARMTGCSETALRRRFENGGVGMLDGAAPASQLTVREKAELALQRAGLRRDAAVIVARLWHSGGGVIGSQDLARGVAGGGAAYDECKAARTEAKTRLGLTFRDKGFGLTEGDLVAVSRLIGEWERRP